MSRKDHTYCELLIKQQDERIEVLERQIEIFEKLLAMKVDKFLPAVIAGHKGKK